MKAGLYTTLAFHLAVLVILLTVTIVGVANPESSFVLDFTGQEEFEARQKEIELKEKVSEQLQEQLGAMPREKVRNVTVDASSLKDDRNTDSRKLYREARDVQKRLEAARRDAIAQEKALEEAVDLGKDSETDTDAKAYRGPSVVSYLLEGRKAGYLHVPAYKGYGGGDVRVMIAVDRKGRVLSARAVDGSGARDPELCALAEDAAKRSRFSASSSADDKQFGEIVYRFVKQS